MNRCLVLNMDHQELQQHYLLELLQEDMQILDKQCLQQEHLQEFDEVL